MHELVKYIKVFRGQSLLYSVDINEWLYVLNSINFWVYIGIVMPPDNNVRQKDISVISTCLPTS